MNKKGFEVEAQKIGYDLTFPKGLKDFIKDFYSVYNDIICTEKIAEVLSISIYNMINANQMKNTQEAIETVLRKDYTYKFVKSRQPNISGVPRTVLCDVEEYFESSGGLNNFIPTHICRKSNDPSDDYLYEVVGYNVKTKEYACWTSWNQSTKSLNMGHYNLQREQEALEIIKDRFNDISDEPGRFGVENTLVSIRKAEISEQILAEPEQEQDQLNNIVRFNGGRAR